MNETSFAGPNKHPEADKNKSSSLDDAIESGDVSGIIDTAEFLADNFVDGATFTPGEESESDTIVLDPDMIPFTAELARELGMTPPLDEIVDLDYSPPAAS